MVVTAVTQDWWTPSKLGGRVNAFEDVRGQELAVADLFSWFSPAQKSRRPWGRRSAAGAAAFDGCHSTPRVSHGGGGDCKCLAKRGVRAFSRLAPLELGGETDGEPVKVVQPSHPGRVGRVRQRGGGVTAALFADAVGIVRRPPRRPASRTPDLAATMNSESRGGLRRPGSGRVHSPGTSG